MQPTIDGAAEALSPNARGARLLDSKWAGASRKVQVLRPETAMVLIFARNQGKHSGRETI
jgi:hypothetical protein